MSSGRPFHSVPIQAKTCTAVGSATKAEAAENVAEAAKAETKAETARAKADTKAAKEKPMPAKGKGNAPSVSDVYESFAGLSPVQMVAFLEKAAIAFAAVVAVDEEKPRADSVQRLTTAAALLTGARDAIGARLVQVAEAA